MPPQNETADPVSGRSAAESESTQQDQSYPQPIPKKTGRTRYLRIFPERATFLLDRLDDKQVGAWLRLALEFVIRDGQVADDDKALARITRLSVRSWRELRATLVELGLGRVVDGRWIDDDQQENLNRQNAFIERQRGAARARWGGGHDA